MRLASLLSAPVMTQNVQCRPATMPPGVWLVRKRQGSSAESRLRSAASRSVLSMAMTLAAFFQEAGCRLAHPTARLPARMNAGLHRPHRGIRLAPLAGGGFTCTDLDTQSYVLGVGLRPESGASCAAATATIYPVACPNAFLQLHGGGEVACLSVAAGERLVGDAAYEVLQEAVVAAFRRAAGRACTPRTSLRTEARGAGSNRPARRASRARQTTPS